jgi:hypothetical protein
MKNNITLFYDQKDQQLKSSNTYATESTSSPVMFVDNDYEYTITIANNATPVDMSSGNNWRVGLGNLGDNTPIINIPDSDIDASNSSSGVLVFTCNTTSTALELAMGQSSIAQFFMEIQANSSSNPITVALYQVQVQNTVY